MSSIGYDASVKSTFGYNDLKELVMDSTYNRGELRLNSKGKLETINSHVTMTWQNHEVTSREENARVRSAIYNFIVGHMAETNHSGNANAIQKFLDAVRESLFADGVAGESLSRDEVRFLLLRATDPKKFVDIPLTSRNIRAVKLGEADYGMDQGARERFLKANIKGYNVSAKKNDVVLGVTDNMQSDKAWRQALATAKSNAARMIDAYERLSEPAKAILRNHIDLELEETWSQAKSLEELNAILKGNPVSARVSKAVHNAHFVKVRNAVTEFAQEHPVAYGQLRSSGIDLLTAVGPRTTEVKEYLGYLAHGMRGLIVPQKTTYPRLLCNKLLERADKRGKDVLNGADPSTMTRSQLLETCVELLKVQSVDEYFEDIAPLTAERVLKAGEPLKDGHEDWVRAALDSNEGRRFLNVLSEGAIAFGMGQTPTRVANLLRQMVNAFPETVDGATRIAEMKAALTEITNDLSNPKFDREICNFMVDSATMGHIVSCFNILNHDKFRVTTDLAAMKTFLFEQFGENWRQIEDLSKYMNELETQANTRPSIGSDYLKSFRLDPGVAGTEQLNATGKGEQIQAPVLKFKLEQLKQVIQDLADMPPAQRVADALRIVKGEILSLAEKKILQTASGKALLESLDRCDGDVGALPELSYSGQLAADEEAQLKRILLPLASRAFQDGRSIKDLADLREAWATAFGKFSASRGCYPVHTTWMFYLNFLTGSAEWKQIADSCITLGIDSTALDLSGISKTNSRLVGPFLQAALSQQNSDILNVYLTAASKDHLSPTDGLNKMIAAVDKVKPENLGLVIANDEEQKLFDSLKWMLPQDCLNLPKPDSPQENQSIVPLENRLIVKIFNELKDAVADLAKTNMPKGDQQAIAEFRQNLMENLVDDSMGRTLFLMVKRQRAEEVDPSNGKKFTAAEWLKTEVGNLTAKQKELEDLVAEVEKDYGYLLSEKDAQKLRIKVLVSAGIDEEDALLDRSQNFDWNGKAHLIDKGISRLKHRRDILEYTVNLANNPNYSGKKALVLAVARIVAMSSKKAFIDEASVDTVLESLGDPGKKQQLQEFSDRLGEQLAGMPEKKTDVFQTMRDIFSYAVTILDSFQSIGMSQKIFERKGDKLGVEDISGFAQAFFCEMLNLDRNLVKRMVEAKAALGDEIKDIMNEFSKTQSYQGIRVATDTLEDWDARYGSGGG